MSPRGGLAFLLSWKPTSWSTREEYFARLCRLLRQQGVQPVLVCPEPFLPQWRARLEESGAAIEICPSRTPAQQGRYFLQLGRIVRRYQVTTAHVRFYDYFSPMPWMARLWGVRHLVFTEANSGDWSGRGWKATAVRARTRLMCYPLARCIAVSRFVKERMVRVGIPAGRIDVVYNGVDTEQCAPSPAARATLRGRLQIRPDEVVIAVAASLLPWKNNQTLIEALAVLARRSVPAHLVIAGDGPERGRLEALAKERGVSGRCHWLGHCRDPVPVLQGCDIFALASAGEAFGNVLAEAMACGVPVVGSRSGAIPEVVEEGVTGVLAPLQDASAFADAFARLAADPALRAAMGVRGRQRACALFSVDRAVRETFQVYERVWAADGLLGS